MPAAESASKTAALFRPFAFVTLALWRSNIFLKSSASLIVISCCLVQGCRQHSLLLNPWPSPRAGGSKGRRKTRKIVCRFGRGPETQRSPATFSACAREGETPLGQQEKDQWQIQRKGSQP